MITHRLQQTVSHLIFATEHNFYFEYSKTKNNFVFSNSCSKFVIENIDMLDALVYISNELNHYQAWTKLMVFYNLMLVTCFYTIKKNGKTYILINAEYRDKL